MRGNITKVLLAVAVLFARLAATQSCFLVFYQPKMPRALRQDDKLL